MSDPLKCVKDPTKDAPSTEPTKKARLATDDVFDLSDHDESQQEDDGQGDGQDGEPADSTSPIKKKPKLFSTGNLSNAVSVITQHTTPRKGVGPDHPLIHTPDQQVEELPVIVEPQKSRTP